MTARRFDDFATRLAADVEEDDEPADTLDPLNPPAPELPEAPGDEPDVEDEDEDETERESTMTTETPLAEREDFKAGHAAGKKEASDRMVAVFASENTKGREAHAVRLLGNDALSAEQIIAELPHFAKAEALSPEAQQQAAEEAGRKEMQDAMGKSGNADLGAHHETAPKTGKAAASAVWDRANAAVGRVKKEG